MFSTPKKYEKYENLWISKYYCNKEPNKWGIWEGLREILQNQFDGILKKIGKKSKIKVIPKNNYIYNGINYQFEFDFMSNDTNDKTIYGFIKYDRGNKRLIIQNLGTLKRTDLLLGGKGEKSKTENEEIIGRHGEGMKLGALAFIRSNKKEKKEGKDFRIFTNEEMWHFILVEDGGFPKENNKNKYIKCLKVGIEKDKDVNHKDKVTVEISPIDLENEWIKYLDRILWLIKWQKDERLNLGVIKAVDEKGKEFGEIFLSEDYRNKIYVKDIFVQEFNEKDDRSVKCFFGFNTDLDLDRDRNAIKDLDKRNILFSKILSNILKRRDDIRKELTGSTYNLFNDYLKHIVYLIEYDYIMIRHIIDPGNLTQKEKDDIWDYLEENKYKEPDYGKIKRKQMIYTSYIGSLNFFLNEKKLPKEFYPYHEINCWLTWHVLVGCGNCKSTSSYYKGWDQLYNEQVKKAEIVKEPNELKETLDRINEKLKNCKSDYKREYIKFKKYNFQFDNTNANIDPRDKIVDFDNKIIYFSESLKNSINNIDTKNWIFKMIINTYHIDLFELCKL